MPYRHPSFPVSSSFSFWSALWCIDRANSIFWTRALNIPLPHSYVFPGLCGDQHTRTDNDVSDSGIPAHQVNFNLSNLARLEFWVSSQLFVIYLLSVILLLIRFNLLSGLLCKSSATYAIFYFGITSEGSNSFLLLCQVYIVFSFFKKVTQISQRSDVKIVECNESVQEKN